jgi:hypothetical protein
LPTVFKSIFIEARTTAKSEASSVLSAATASWEAMTRHPEPLFSALEDECAAYKCEAAGYRSAWLKLDGYLFETEIRAPVN